MVRSCYSHGSGGMVVFKTGINIMENLKPVPENYKEVTEESVRNISRATRRIIPIIEELGDNFEIEVEDYQVWIVTIKRKDKDGAFKN